MTISDIPELEALAAAAWPAEEQTALGPWRLRATRGVTSRANSVFTTVSPGDPPVTDVDRLIAGAEAFYAQRRLPPLFQLTPASTPSDLDPRLARRGYSVLTPSEVWTADVRAVLARATAPEGGEAVLTARPDGAWLDCAFDEPPARRQVHEGILGRIDRPALFASLRVRGVVLACGLCVSGEGRAGIFSMVTRPEHRGRGAARRILRELARWASERGDRALYLHVTFDNRPARALYRRCGFDPAYPYHYRLKAAREPRARSPV